MYTRPKVRNDSQGQGHYGAPRGSRKHNGIDFELAPGEKVLSHIDGVVTKIGYPYKQKFDTKKDSLKSALRYVQVTDASNDTHHRFFYVDPSVGMGDPIVVGSNLGICQNLEEIYMGMKNHCHYEVKVKGEHVDPKPYL